MLVVGQVVGGLGHCRARWSCDELGLSIAALIADRLSDPGAPLLVVIDDTLLQRGGRRVYGAFFHHDATANSDRARVGQQLGRRGIVVRLPILARPICLPVLFRLWRPRRGHIPKGQPDPERPSKPRLAREAVDLLAARFASGRCTPSATPRMPRAPGARCPRV